MPVEVNAAIYLSLQLYMVIRACIIVALASMDQFFLYLPHSCVNIVYK
jgi:hypothetical protein